MTHWLLITLSTLITVLAAIIVQVALVELTQGDDDGHAVGDGAGGTSPLWLMAKFLRRLWFASPP